MPMVLILIYYAFFAMLWLDFTFQLWSCGTYVQYWQRLKVLYSEDVFQDALATGPKVSVLIAAYNERPVIARTLASVLASAGANTEIIVVDDGSKDETDKEVERIAATDSRLRLLRNSTNMGKSLSLRRAIADSSGDIICLVDADVEISDDFIPQLVDPITANTYDATCGNVIVRNRSSVIPIWQSIEYISILHRIKAFQHMHGAITTIAGGASAFRRLVLERVGGYIPDQAVDCLAEDSDFTIRLVRSHFRVGFVPQARAFTDTPRSFRALFYQRRRWIFGNMQCSFKHLSDWRSYGDGTVFGLPYFTYENCLRPIHEALRLSGAIFCFALSGSSFPLLLVGGSLTISMARQVSFYVLERRNVADLLWLPMRSLVWPVFAMAPLMAAGWLFWRGRGVAWMKATRAPVDL